MADLSVATGSVLVKSETPVDAELVHGPTACFGTPSSSGSTVDITTVAESHLTIGYQATHLGRSVQMLETALAERSTWHTQQLEELRKELEEETKAGINDEGFTTMTRTDTAESSAAPGTPEFKNFLLFAGMSTNVMATGCREALCFMVRHELVDIMVLSAGAPEHDLRRLFTPSLYQVSPNAKYSHDSPGNTTGASTRGEVKMGNVTLQPGDSHITPNFDDFMSTLLPVLQAEQQDRYERCQKDAHKYEEACSSTWAWTPSTFWSRVGKELVSREEAEGTQAALPQVDYKSSVLYWAAKHSIPIFSPNFSDGDVALNLMKFNSRAASTAAAARNNEKQPQPEGAATAGGDGSAKKASKKPPMGPVKTKPKIVMDLVRDIGLLNKAAMKAKRTAMLILGGGIIKHHVCNANLMRNGADYAIFINNAQEYDGSDAGARPDEAVSWGKIRLDGKSTKVYGEVSLVFPLLVTQACLPFVAQKQLAEEEGQGSEHKEEEEDKPK